ncbi:MAG: sodium/solute symporter [Pirellulaceae bacterium]
MAVLDYLICGGYLVLVIALGWWCARGQKTNTEYFVGSRKMNWLAVGISLFATTFSALSFVGLPREAAYEDYHLYTAILFIPLVAAPIAGWLFVPLYHNLQLISAYEYLERRFNRRLRLIGSALACLYMLAWMGNMLYATGLILLVVLGLSDVPMALPITLIVLGLFTTIYTSLGGFQAVVWTDVAQAVVLFGGMMLVLLITVSRIDGGWLAVWRIGQAHDRFAMFDMDFDLSDRANFFTAAAYGIFVYIAAMTTGQSAVQRYVSMPSVSAARWSLAVNGVLVAGVCLVFFLVGSAMFAFYQQHPAADAVAGSSFPNLLREDQLTPHFIQTQLKIPGLMGLLLAGLFAAVMSSIDSSANSITTLVVCDWLPGKNEVSVGTTKLLCGVAGLSAIGAALLVPYLGEHVFDILVTIAGAFFGPLLGIFALGVFVPRASGKGAVIGLCGGVMGLLVVAATSIPAEWLSDALPESLRPLAEDWPAKISPWWYGAFTCVPTFFVGLAASYLFPPPDPKRVQGLTVFSTAGAAALHDDESVEEQRVAPNLAADRSKPRRSL